MQALMTASVEGEVLSPAEVVANCVLLLFAGHETTTNLIGNGLLTLLRYPDQLQRLRETPGLIESAVEELLRYESPVQVTGRYATEDLDALALAFDDADVHAHRVSGLEFLLIGRGRRHVALRSLTRSGLFFRVSISPSFSRHARMRAWSPDSSTSTTACSLTSRLDLPPVGRRAGVSARLTAKPASADATLRTMQRQPLSGAAIRE